MEEVIASLSLIGVPRTGPERPVEVSVCRPRPRDGAWACAVSVTGLDARSRDIYGEDAMQALLLGLDTVWTHLSIFVGSGGQLLCPEGRAVFPLSAYFPAAWAVAGAA